MRAIVYFRCSRKTCSQSPSNTSCWYIHTPCCDRGSRGWKTEQKKGPQFFSELCAACCCCCTALRSLHWLALFCAGAPQPLSCCVSSAAGLRRSRPGTCVCVACVHTDVFTIFINFIQTQAHNFPGMPARPKPPLHTNYTNGMLRIPGRRVQGSGWSEVDERKSAKTVRTWVTHRNCYPSHRAFCLMTLGEQKRDAEWPRTRS